MSRRRCLLLVGCLLAACSFAKPSPGGETHVLACERQAGDLAAVKVLLEVTGDVKIVDQQKVRTLPLKLAAEMDYQERMLSAADEQPRSVRHYKQAQAKIEIAATPTERTLRPDRRLVGADWRAERITLFSPDGPFSRDELELVDLPANSLAVDALLPSKAVEVGGTWKHPQALLAVLLGLDAVGSADAESVLKSASQQEAKIELAGRVEGAIEGIATEIELKGKYTYDFRARRITYLGLLIKEKRSIGHVAAGLDVTARLQMSVAPLDQAPALTDEALAGLPLVADEADTRLVHEVAGAGLRVYHDRRWHAVGDDEKTLSLRLVDRGDLIAQCNVAGLAKAAPGEHVTLARFQADIRKALGESFGEFRRATEGTDSRGRTLYATVAEGKASGLAIVWHYYLVADAQGRQAALAFTFEPELAERLAGADGKLTESLEFLEPDTAAQPTPAPR